MPWPHAFTRATKTLDMGGTAKIYRCRDQLGTPAVCKVVPKASANLDSKARKEIACLADLAFSPYVVNMYEALEGPEAHYIIMQLCRGGSVQALLARSGGACAEDTARAIMQGVLRGLVHAHGCAIIHRDIKPGNVLALDECSALDPLGIKLIDFGSAERMPSTLVPEVPIHDIVGTVPFMAPETLQSRLGPKSDVWSSGVMAHQILTGRLPFEDRDHVHHPTARGVWRSILKDEPVWTGPRWDGISLGAIDFCRACLAKDMVARPTAAEALGHAWLLEDDTDNDLTEVLGR